MSSVKQLIDKTKAALTGDVTYMDAKFAKVMREEGVRDVLVIFSSRNTAAGKFTLYKSVAHIRAHKIFLNDENNRWFLFGCPSIGDYAETVAWLKTVIGALLGTGGQVTCVGSSMGGFAAIRYGFDISANRILVFSPETELCLPHGRSIGSLKKEWVKPEHDLNHLAFPKTVQILYYTGNSDFVDLYCATRFLETNPHAEVIVCNNVTHGTTKYLHGLMTVPMIVSSFFEGRDYPTSGPGLGPVTTTVAEARRLLAIQQTQRAGEPLPRNDADFILDLARAHPDWSLINYEAAMVLKRNKDLDGALAMLEQAAASRPVLGRAHLQLGILARSMDRLERSAEVLANLLAVAPTPSVALEASKTFEKMGELGKAASALFDGIRLEGAHADRKLLSDALYRIGGLLQERALPVPTMKSAD